MRVFATLVASLMFAGIGTIFCKSADDKQESYYFDSHCTSLF